MNGVLAGTTSLITGAASGIGRAAVDVFAREGADLILADIAEDVGGGLIDQASAHGVASEYVITDVADREAMLRLVDRGIDRFGSIQSAFLNAGISGPSAAAHEWDVEAWNRVLAVNLTGVWNGISALVPHFLEQGGGSIVSTSSVSGITATAGKAPYVSSKHAVVGLTKSAALDYASLNIRINAVCPGPILTPLLEKHINSSPDPAEVEAMISANVPLGRLGTPAEVAEAAVWLCSERASFITGFSVAVDGGYVAR